jgi:glucose-1-phosphate cytidylyltransferase
MKVVILAGGLGTRLSEETESKPKPMVEIGDYPILWHIMKIYSYYGYNDFIICLGYKGYVIKEYFSNYFLHKSDLTIDLSNNKISYENTTTEPWKITLVDTGINTMTGGRVRRVEKYIGNNSFMLTYGDGVSDVNINALVGFHSANKKIATVTAVQPAGRFGSLSIDEKSNSAFLVEKPLGDNFWINGGFFVFKPEIFDYIDRDDTILERAPLETISNKNELVAFKHHGFWQPMDTLREKNFLNDLWKSDKAPWRLWDG